MTIVRQLFAILVLAAFASQSAAGVCHSPPGAGADVLHQQTIEKILEEEESEEEEDEEPDCE